MKADLKPGKYILAVSGGVDSMVLLDLLAGRPKLDLVVAHFDHGIRSCSASDAMFVKSAAKSYGLTFELGHGHLGPTASEDQARVARYKFLESVRQKYRAEAIITAHHQDDLIETALINTLRGTGPRGLTAIMHNPNVIRPLLPFAKAQILNYAKARGLSWVEDQTNTDQRYLRNRVRAKLMPKLSKEARQKTLTSLYRLEQILSETDAIINEVCQEVIGRGGIDRARFTALPQAIGQEVLYRQLKEQGVPDVDRPTVERLALAVRVARPGTSHAIKKDFKLKVKRDTAQIAVSNRGWYN